MLHFARLNGYLALDLEECREAGRALAERYRNASPFPHVIIDDFLEPDVLEAVLRDFPSSKDKAFFDRDQERLKFQYQPYETGSAIILNLFAELNSHAFVAFLEEMTGFQALIPDPRFEGGGLHETKRGGHLGVHADFNIHSELEIERKLNVLIYLNQDWDDKFGGELELWDKQMRGCEVKVKPVFGRAVVFTTALDSFHGHPDPLKCLPDRSRRSIATYYYSAPGAALMTRRTTNFQPRPGSEDKRDWAIRRVHLINDWIPPRLQRFAHRLFG